MDLKTLLTNRKPKEGGGAIATNRIAYQADWAICKILELHQKQDDYVIVFEYHDDVLILDSASDPKTAEFFQIKTKDKGNWTIKLLVKHASDRNSILGKLFLHKTMFKDSVKSLNLVSNAKYKIGKKLFEEIACINIEAQFLKQVQEQLCAEFNINDLDGFEGVAFLKTSTLGVNEHSSITKGKIVDFLEQLFPLKQYNVAAFYKTIFGEISRKSSYEQDVNSLAVLVDKKSITREDFQKYLSAVTSSSEEFKQKQMQIYNKLVAEKASVVFLKEFNLNCTKLEGAKISNEDVFIKLYEDISNYIKNNPLVDSSEQTMIEIANAIYEKYYTTNPNIEEYVSIFGESFIKCLILFEII